MLLALNGYHSIVRCTNSKIHLDVTKATIAETGALTPVKAAAVFAFDDGFDTMCARLSSLNRYIEDPHADDTIFRIQPFFAQNQKNGLASPRRGKPNNSTTHGATQKAKGRAKE